MEQVQSGIEHASFVDITPEMAEEFLLKNSKNRTLSQRRVSLYASAMQDGKWRVTHQGVAVFADGILADGQHRLHAIIKADLPVKMLLVTGLHPDSADGIDQHRARKISDVAKIVGKDWLDSVGVAIVRLMYGMEAATAADVLSVAENVFPSVVFAKNNLSRSTKGVSSPVMAAFSLAHFHGVDEEVLSRYAAVLGSGLMDNNDTDVAAFRMREWLAKGQPQRGTSDRERLMKAVMRNINHFQTGTPISRVSVPETNDFEILKP